MGAVDDKEGLGCGGGMWCGVGAFGMTRRSDDGRSDAHDGL